jgi:hypothetical protein
MKAQLPIAVPYSPIKTLQLELPSIDWKIAGCPLSSGRGHVRDPELQAK